MPTTYTSTTFLLLLFFSIHALAYYTTMIRAIHPNWFKSFNYLLSSVPLNRRTPSQCYETIGRSAWGDIDWFAVYNNPGEVPIDGLAFYNNRFCGLKKTTNQPPPKKPVAVVVFSNNNRNNNRNHNHNHIHGAREGEGKYGIRLINFKRLGIQYNRGSYISFNLTEELAKRDTHTGLFGEIPANVTIDNGVYVWEGEPENLKRPGRYIAYLPDSVDIIPEPTDILERVDLEGDRIGYTYLRDLVERFLIGPEKAGQIVDTVTPWIEDRLGSVGNGVVRKPPALRGPLYERGAGEGKGYATNENAWEVEKWPGESGRKGKNGRSVMYPVVKSGGVPGVVYFEREGYEEAPLRKLRKAKQPDEDEEPDDVSLNSGVARKFQDFLAAEEEEESPAIEIEYMKADPELLAKIARETDHDVDTQGFLRPKKRGRGRPAAREKVDIPEILLSPLVTLPIIEEDQTEDAGVDVSVSIEVGSDDIYLEDEVPKAVDTQEVYTHDLTSDGPTSTHRNPPERLDDEEGEHLKVPNLNPSPDRPAMANALSGNMQDPYTSQDWIRNLDNGFDQYGSLASLEENFPRSRTSTGRGIGVSTSMEDSFEDPVFMTSTGRRPRNLNQDVLDVLLEEPDEY
ncbi:hypothetical protein TWF694_007576 [Orbilia ellipsospora]|uniref:Uncharacterized protein n=1 Tax=Orbilia ellipsospora TaxID=2528407 RepID=A0AAV9XJN4_9PEZI